ncbi:MAG: DNA replication/repair protein RecF [candidate division Zixibacteria bacterium]|nr:DNA replication/repair protein RecF [candidate division Zixibacteria bacterium]MDH3936612.1 DNA replication/repair protein RecF [candidate division Zixibacteria bacterium]MDH4032581.1 DNA replication/repair protein RecF [candidate division Zixibacteria bacterium]
MQIKSLSVVGFRNFSSVKVEFSDGVNILSGDNGSGKTNLLEAIHTLCLGRSQRGAGDQVLLGSQSDVYRLEGELQNENEICDVTAAYQRGGRKKLTIDGLSARLSELYEHFSVVSAGPEDNGVVADSPSVRRAFLDIHLSQLSFSYLTDLSDYQRALAQKNAALKSEGDSSPFDTIMVAVGSRIMHARARFIADVNQLASAFYRRLSSGEELAIEYRPSVSFDQIQSDSEAIAASMKARLEQMHNREAILQTALVGPHRDDMYFGLADLPARSHGSQGQWRSIAIVLKLAVFDLLKKRRGQTPILLLDEVFAELDAKRCDALIGAFGDMGQLFLTTAVTAPDSLRQNSRNFEIVDGKVEMVG